METQGGQNSPAVCASLAKLLSVIRIGPCVAK